MSKETFLSKSKREILSWWESFKTKPFPTVLIGFLIIVFFGLLSIAPRAANDLYSLAFHQSPQNPFKEKRIIYSNIIPTENDVISLGGSGHLTPSPYNATSIKPAPNGACQIEGITLNYSEGIVLILNARYVLSSLDPSDLSKRVRVISLVKESPKENYLTFKLGDNKKITTEDGRIFSVTLANMTNLSTNENGSYYSYSFEIIEK